MERVEPIESALWGGEYSIQDGGEGQGEQQKEEEAHYIEHELKAADYRQCEILK